MQLLTQSIKSHSASEENLVESLTHVLCQESLSLQRQQGRVRYLRHLQCIVVVSIASASDSGASGPKTLHPIAGHRNLAALPLIV